MKGNKELIKRFLENSKYQDKLDFYDKEETEKCLIDFIEAYQDLYFMEDNEILDELGKDILMSKRDILKGLERYYRSQLNILKRLGVDISEYPKGLEDLIE